VLNGTYQRYWNSEVSDRIYQRYWNSEVPDGTYQRYWNSEVLDAKDQLQTLFSKAPKLGSITNIVSVRYLGFILFYFVYRIRVFGMDLWRNNIGWDLWEDWYQLEGSLFTQNFEGCGHFRLFGQLHDRISKVFRLLDEISKLLDERILKVLAPFERTSKVLAPFERTSKIPTPFERTLKNFEGPVSHLKELRR
ncbi:hypothetical protein RhiirC2_798594, partial [Rhizophagus irregularis]